jgi:hypothetical protein
VNEPRDDLDPCGEVGARRSIGIRRNEHVGRPVDSHREHARRLNGHPGQRLVGLEFEEPIQQRVFPRTQRQAGERGDNPVLECFLGSPDPGPSLEL